MSKKTRALGRYIADNFIAAQPQWFAWVPFLFALGIAIYFSLPVEPAWWLSLVAVEIWLLLFYLCRFKSLNLLFISGLIIICGFINIQMRTIYQSKFVRFEPKQMTYLTGRIADISYNTKGAPRYLLDNAANWRQTLRGKYRITATGKHPDFSIGQCIELVGTVFPPSRVPVLNGFQLDRKYFYEELSGIGYANSEIFAVKCPKDMPLLSFKARLNKLRRHISERTAQILPPTEAGIADALLIGEKSKISDTIVNHYRGSGLAHFLAVSGLHLGTIAGLIFFLVRLILALFPHLALRIDIKKPAAIAAIIFSGLYLLISGMAVPAERAFIMTTVVLIGVIFNRQAISMRMVSFAALAVLIIMPQALISISFQMSFAAVYGLVAFYEKFSSFLAHRRKTANFFFRLGWYLLGIVIADLIASLATAPFAIYHFKQLSVYTSLGNLLAGPLIGLLIMPTVLACLAALPFDLALWPLKGLGYGIELLNTITARVSALPHSLLAMPEMPFWGFILVIIGAFWLCTWRKNWRLWGFIPMIIGLSSLFFAIKPTMVFAPQGQAIALRNNAKQMIMLPSQTTDRWLKQVWQENLRLTPPTESEKNIFKQISNGTVNLPNSLDLQCQNGLCRYKQAVQFDLDGTLSIEQKPVNLTAGGYIFENRNHFTFTPLWNIKQCRRWQANYPQCLQN